MQKPLTKKEIKEIILRELPKLIKKDMTTREFVLQLAQERFADKKKTEDRFETLLKEIKVLREDGEKRWQENQKKWEEYEKRWQENEKRWRENEKRWQENQKRLEQMEAEWNKRWEENQKVINSILDEIKLLQRRHDTSIGALVRGGGSGQRVLSGMP